MDSMTSVERVETVLAGRIPDRVPVDLADFMMAAQASGMPFPEYLHDGEAMAEGHIGAWREFGHDVVVVESGTASLAEACGAGVVYMDGSAPVSLTPAIDDLDDVDRLVVPDPQEAGPLALNLKATRIIAREVGEGAFVIGRADQGPFSLASMLMGMEGFLMALVDPGSGPRSSRAPTWCPAVSRSRDRTPAPGQIKAATESRSTILGVIDLGVIDSSAVMALGTLGAVTAAVREELGVLACVPTE